MLEDEVRLVLGSIANQLGHSKSPFAPLRTLDGHDRNQHYRPDADSASGQLQRPKLTDSCCSAFGSRDENSGRSCLLVSDGDGLAGDLHATDRMAGDKAGSGTRQGLAGLSTDEFDAIRDFT